MSVDQLSFNLETTHRHYPDSEDDAWELYDDLRDFGGLTHEEAIETVGYAVDMDAAECPQIVSNGSSWIWHWEIMPRFEKAEERELYLNGIDIAETERAQS